MLWSSKSCNSIIFYSRSADIETGKKYTLFLLTIQIFDVETFIYEVGEVGKLSCFLMFNDLLHFNVVVGMEVFYKPTIDGIHSPHEKSSENGVYLFNFTAARNLRITDSFLPHKRIDTGCIYVTGHLVANRPCPDRKERHELRERHQELQEGGHWIQPLPHRVEIHCKAAEIVD